MSSDMTTPGSYPYIYREWRGDGSATPLLLIHGGGSTIETNWGRLLPLVEQSRRVLAVELQGHGHTDSGSVPPTFESAADAVADVLGDEATGPVDVLGFSNGGQVAMQLAARHPHAVRRLIVGSAPYRRDGMVDGFWEGLEAATVDDLPEPYRRADLAASGDPQHTHRMFHLDRNLMLTGFVDWPDDVVQSIAAPTLVVAGDRDVIRLSHLVDLARLIPNARLLIVPGNHGDYLGELFATNDDRSLRNTLPILLDFLDIA
jgi:pimeloyl-ACP methyl ester carboxylesterase